MSSVSDNLFGAYTHKLDPKNRIAIPTEWRPLIEKIKSAPGYSEAQIDLFIGKLYANCVEAIINAQGKLLIPKPMCEHAQLSSAVRLAGRGGYFELWEPSAYEEVALRENASISDINQSFGIF